ncbi:hypothetical protein PCC9214_03924 [Planktothrix tepida]|uniref:ABM domain-containing protein n=2 Tax=Planktothrix TaxID=54304 RepID=A0A1J1LPG7_9CYAN|nr:MULTISPECIES: antibiotic biosynthesis monooxygenase [Planktothrix]CAD5937810.1 hypothetical protein NO713_01717 [Planktothrix pseudagardhii]CAD5972631.1 hypothetical protein PCC9214_03924 [Planktothrix tepida]CUR34464.1 conserved hypothetical protein [Planktothrix tepida PCC 9214]
MIRVIYRWKVQPEKKTEFIQAWTQATETIRHQVLGSKGSLLLRSTQHSSEFIAIARWETLEHWQKFWQGDPPDPQAFQIMQTVSQLLSHQVCEEIEDLTLL